MHLKDLTELRELRLGRAQITDAGFAELPGHKVAPTAPPAAGAGPVGHTLCAPASNLLPSGYAYRRS